MEIGIKDNARVFLNELEDNLSLHDYNFSDEGSVTAFNESNSTNSTVHYRSID